MLIPPTLPTATLSVPSTYYPLAPFTLCSKFGKTATGGVVVELLLVCGYEVMMSNPLGNPLGNII